jgi:hypothetical protein
MVDRSWHTLGGLRMSPANMFITAAACLVLAFIAGIKAGQRPVINIYDCAGQVRMEQGR